MTVNLGRGLLHVTVPLFALEGLRRLAERVVEDGRSVGRGQNPGRVARRDRQGLQSARLRLEVLRKTTTSLPGPARCLTLVHCAGVHVVASHDIKINWHGMCAVSRDSCWHRRAQACQPIDCLFAARAGGGRGAGTGLCNSLGKAPSV
jgi:hypothetical protein